MNRVVREALTLVAVFSILLGALWLYTGSWPPAVIVESGSMMHADSEVGYGRFGTIDPGDLVLVKDVDGVDDVTTLVEGGRDRYGKPGDVIVYYRANDRASTPIIHRAIAYVEVAPADDGLRFDVRWAEGAPCEGGATKLERDGRAWCRYGNEGVLIPSASVWTLSRAAYRPTSTGFLTKGDNPVTNTQLDQLAGISYDARGNSVPVPIEWVSGEGRGELPWLGLLKLALAGKPNEDHPPAAWVKVGSAFAPKDLWVMLAVSLAVIVGGPIAWDAARSLRERSQRARKRI